MEPEKPYHNEKNISLKLVAPPVADGTYLAMGDRKLSVVLIQEKEIVDPNAPKDPYKFVLITMFFLGFAGMLPVTFMITANEYWMYKFRNVSEGETTDATHRTPLQMAYATYLMLLMIAPAILFNIIFTFVGHKVAMNTRARVYYFLLYVVFFMHFVFSLINTDSWQAGFFAVVMGSQVVLSFGLSLGMVIMTVANKFPNKYFLYHIIGGGLEGFLIALLRFLSLLTTDSVKNSGTVYFACGVVLMTVAVLLFELTLRTDFYRFYVTKVQEEDAGKKANSMAEIIHIAKKIWEYALVALLNLIAPAGALLTLVVSKDQGSGSLWADTYFVTVCTYLIPSLAGLIGRAMSQLWDEILTIRMLIFLSLAKMIIFTPLTYICNAQPRHNFPVLLGEDWEYALVGFFNAALTGYLMNVVTIRVAKFELSTEHAELALRILTTTMIASGVLMAPISILAIKIL